MEAQALHETRLFRWRRPAVAVALVLVLAAIGTAIGVVVWLLNYEPLAKGSSFGADWTYGRMVEPPTGSEGMPVFFPRYRENGTFRVATSVRNRGRFTVTIVGLDKNDSGFNAALRPVRLEDGSQWVRPYHGSLVDAEHPIRVRPGREQELFVVYRFVWRCIGGQPAHFWKTGVRPSSGISGWRSIPLRIRYAGHFETTQFVPTSFAITFVCRDQIVSPQYVSG